MISSIDINCDLGESTDLRSELPDKEIMPYISSCNIACGYHAGDKATMVRTIRYAKQHGVSIGAHPSYPDRVNFGRRSMKLSSEELKQLIVNQIELLHRHTKQEGVAVQHVKLHGALYNDAMESDSIAATICSTIAEEYPGMMLYGMPESALCSASEKYGLPYVAEYFADRKYEDIQKLKSRKEPGAVFSNRIEVLAQMEEIVLDQELTTLSGKVKISDPGTICLHSDTPGSIAMAKEMFHFLKENNVKLHSPGKY